VNNNILLGIPRLQAQNDYVVKIFGVMPPLATPMF